MRTPNPVIVTGPDGLPLAGARVYTRDADTGEDVAVFAERTGRRRGENPAITDARGRVAQYLERGAYACEIRTPAGAEYVEEWDAQPGGAPLDESQIPDGLITGRMLAERAVGARELDPDAIAALAVVPVGAEIRYAGAPPDGFDVCDGGLLDRDEHQAYFAAVLHAHNHGVDPGAGKVRKPDRRGDATKWIVRIQ